MSSEIRELKERLDALHRDSTAHPMDEKKALAFVEAIDEHWPSISAALATETGETMGSNNASVIGIQTENEAWIKALTERGYKVVPLSEEGE